MSDSTPASGELSDQKIIGATRCWLERAVIGLNLCPFARAPYLGDRVRFRVSQACNADELLADLQEELRLLQQTDPEVVETTLLIHPWALVDFLDYNDFLEVADACIEHMELDGEMQVASFHPDYQFAGTAPDDPENNSNRSPFPTLHLLRESSIERVVDAVHDTDRIYQRNIDTLRRLGATGWAALWNDDKDDAPRCD